MYIKLFFNSLIAPILLGINPKYKYKIKKTLERGFKKKKIVLLPMKWPDKPVAPVYINAEKIIGFSFYNASVNV